MSAPPAPELKWWTYLPGTALAFASTFIVWGLFRVVSYNGRVVIPFLGGLDLDPVTDPGQRVFVGLIAVAVGVVCWFLKFKRPEAMLQFSAGLVGFVLAGAVGYLLRPVVPIHGQLDFNTVISRGTNLQGMDQLLKSYAQQSFNYMLLAGIMGVVAALLLLRFCGPYTGNDRRSSA